jgi:hypothetical protein
MHANLKLVIRTCGTVGLSLAALAFTGCRLAAGGNAADAVYVNGVRLDDQELQSVVQVLGKSPQPGRYWYDNATGLAGYLGQGPCACLPAGLNLGGPLAADASNGTTGVLVNGRELTQPEVSYLERLLQGRLARGRYWVMANGDAGREGGPVLVNLQQLASAAARQGRGRNWSWRSNTTGVNAVGDGNFVAVFGKDFSVITGN